MNGVIRVMRLAELGVPSHTAYRRCGPEGPWRRLLPGIVSLFAGPPSWAQLVSAALLYGGDTALITGAEACRRHSLRNVPADERTVHLLVPHGRKLHNNSYVIVERTHRMPTRLTRSNVPVAPLSRAVLDTARRMNDLDAVRALLAEAVQRSLTTVERLSAELNAGSRRGSALPRRVLAELVTGAQSVAEIDANQIWDRSGLPAPVWNKRLLDERGRYVATPDAWFAEAGLAWEIDSLAFHLDPQSYRNTLARNARYAAAGITVLQTLPARLRQEPETVVAELQAAHAAAAARSRLPN